MFCDNNEINNQTEFGPGGKKTKSAENPDKPGRQTRENEMNYEEWAKILGDVTRLISRVILQNRVTAELSRNNGIKGYSFADSNAKVLIIDIFSVRDKKLLLEYTVVPRQNFSRDAITGPTSIPEMPDRLFTVTDFAVIFTSGFPAGLDSGERQYAEQFDTAFKKVVDYDLDRSEVDEETLNIPDNVRIIEGHNYKHYVDLQIAVPGSSLPDFAGWAKVTENKMLYLSLIPDMGPVKNSWIVPETLKISSYYTSVEKELLELFAAAVDKSIKNPDNRNQIYTTTRDSMRSLFSAANSYVNFLFHESDSRLARWLLLSEQAAGQPELENMFPDYVPKTTPDTAIDFMPELSAQMNQIPAAKPENLVRLINLLKHYQDRAKKNPGQWVDGNVILGANPREYRPSPDELLASETGNRLRTALRTTPNELVRKLMREEKIKPEKLQYTTFTFTHVDVMGSGRFFYVDTIEKVNLELK
ncbi:hypothetical protein JXQ31_12260 [candidate division KSB1 bacterium]|nr:hypothetical protein [candidate division KSB1 bacterium]